MRRLVWQLPRIKSNPLNAAVTVAAPPLFYLAQMRPPRNNNVTTRLSSNLEHRTVGPACQSVRFLGQRSRRVSLIGFPRVAKVCKCIKEPGGVVLFTCAPQFDPSQPRPHLNHYPPNIFPHRATMSFNSETVIDLLDELDLDIQGFEDTPQSSLLFSLDSYDYSEAPTSTLDVSAADEELPTFELLEEIELGPRKWVAASPPVWDDAPRSTAACATAKDAPCRDFRSITIDVPPRTPSRSALQPFTKENLSSPTERAFARLRERGSSFALRALNSALASPEIHNRVLI